MLNIQLGKKKKNYLLFIQQFHSQTFEINTIQYRNVAK